MAESDLREQFEQYMAQTRDNSVLSPKYRRRKVIGWMIRTALAVALYALLWEYRWVRWTLLIYVPLNLFGLLSIFAWKLLLERKIRSTENTVEEAEFEIIEEDGDKNPERPDDRPE